MSVGTYARYSFFGNSSGGVAGVSSVNGLVGAVTLAAGANITLTPSGNTITIASSGGAAPVFGEVPAVSGSTSLAVTFGVPQGSTAYAVVCSFLNLVDVDPQYQPITIIAKSTTGFTAEWDAPLSSANYLLDYIVVG